MRACRLSATRNGHGAAVDGDEEVLHADDVEAGEAQVGDRRAALEAGQGVGQRVAAVDLGRPVGADGQGRPAVGAGDALEDRDRLGVGPVEVVEHDRRPAAVEHLADELAGHARGGC